MKDKKDKKKSVKEKAPKINTDKTLEKKTLFSDKTSILNKIDVRIMAILVIIYGILAFTNLGTLKTPNTYYKFDYSGEEVGVEVEGVSQHISKMRVYTGAEVGKFMIVTSTDGKEYHNLKNFETKSVFAWEEVEIDKDLKYIKFVAEDSGSYLGDIALYDTYGNRIKVISTDDQSKVILDESKYVPVQINSKNSAYFDEIYFARSAYEYTHGIDTMEWTHPPLGKLLMAIPVLLLGFSTLSYRLMGVVAGMAMIPVMYILAKRLFKDRKWALLAGMLMMFDNFHFAHTRMATVDSFLVLFILLSVLFMKQYIDMDRFDNFKKKRTYLLLSGLFIGCALCVKWTALYAMLGLMIVFFVDLFVEREDKRKTKINYNTASKIALMGMVLLSLVPIIVYYLTTLLINTKTATTYVFWYYFALVLTTLIVLVVKLLKKDSSLKHLFIVCLIGFVLIPILIYVLSYIMFPNVHGYTSNSLNGIINQIKNMYNYHSTLAERHPFESEWYKWPAMIKPVWYYVGYHGGNLKSTIVGIGNPIIWWSGILASIFVAIKTIFKRNKETFFILMFILCTFMPYMFIGRAMFMYHYFPTLPFVMLAIVALMKAITEKIKTDTVYIFYTLLIIVVFFVFYPITSGIVTTNEYIDALKWLSSWVF